MTNYTKSLTGMSPVPVEEKALPTLGMNTFEQNKSRHITCKRCGSDFVVRYKPRFWLLAFMVEAKGQKRFRCWNCGFVFYSFARRKEDRIHRD